MGNHHEKSKELNVKIVEIFVKQFPNYNFSTNEPENLKLRDIGLDSINFIRIIVTLEANFGIEFEDDDLDLNRYVTIFDLIDYVSKKVNS